MVWLMSYPQLTDWLTQHAFGAYLSSFEQQFIRQKLAVLRFGTIMQFGFSQWQFKEVFAAESEYLVQNNHADANVAVVAENNFLPWAEQSVDTIIWPHGLDTLSAPDETIAEMARILVPGGHLILTGLNVKGYWRLFYQRGISISLHLLSASAAVKRMQRIGLFLEEGQFMGYGIPSCYGTNHHTIEYMGNRWWPHLAAIYGLVLVKRTIPLTLTPQNTSLILNPVSNMAMKGIELD